MKSLACSSSAVVLSPFFEPPINLRLVQLYCYSPAAIIMACFERNFTVFMATPEGFGWVAPNLCPLFAFLLPFLPFLAAVSCARSIGELSASLGHSLKIRSPLLSCQSFSGNFPCKFSAIGRSVARFCLLAPAFSRKQGRHAHCPRLA